MEPKIKSVYIGRNGCSCGCRGRYYESGPMLKRVFSRVMKACRNRVEWEKIEGWAGIGGDLGGGLELAFNFSEDGRHWRVWRVYFGK